MRHLIEQVGSRENRWSFLHEPERKTVLEQHRWSVVGVPIQKESQRTLDGWHSSNS
jgi:hypothetical protein